MVGAARVARLWGLWDPVDQVDRESLETRNRNWQYLVIGTGLVTLGARHRRSRRGSVAPGRPIGGLVGLVADGRRRGAGDVRQHAVSHHRRARALDRRGRRAATGARRVAHRGWTVTIEPIGDVLR